MSVDALLLRVHEAATAHARLHYWWSPRLPFAHPDCVNNVLGVRRCVQTKDLVVDEGLDLCSISCLDLRPVLHDLLLGEELILRNGEDGEALVVDDVVPETRILAPWSRYMNERV